MYGVFFFKQKTAYEMRISDWSSDVCSSDLPSHHVAYMYNYAGHPWRTQERLKQIVDSQYKPTPDGLSGNDDLGQMSAWMFFTGLGFRSEERRVGKEGVSTC